MLLVVEVVVLVQLELMVQLHKQDQVVQDWMLVQIMEI
tara:strand:+ start:386 stop:499 length:114 start_codon:yes stop_codon:yes gene_type:complete